MSKEKILFFWEDDEDLVKVFFLFFQEHGFLTEKVESPDDCVEVCKETPPHVLVICRSPHQPSNVLSFIHRLRSDSSIPYIPIVGYANFAKNEKEAGHHALFIAGANACFGHPFDLEDILGPVKTLVGDPTRTNLIDRKTAWLYDGSKPLK